MTITYQLTRESARTGVSRSFAHRHPLMRFLTPALGVFFLGVSALYFLSSDDSHWMLGTMMLALGALYFFLPFHRVRKAAANIFAGRSGDISVEMTTSDENITIKTPDSTGTASWESFVDFKICEDGILIYPQKNMHFWVPATAGIESGTWQEFADLISNKITRKF